MVEALPKHPTKKYRNRRQPIRRIAIHHSAGPGNSNPVNIARFHIGPARDWPGIAYHYFIESSGKISKVNYHETMSFHVGGHNEDSLGICLDGTFVSHDPTDEQLASLKFLLDKLKADIPTAEIIQAHKKFGNQTSCCGDLRRGWYKAIEWEREQDEPATIDLLPYLRGHGELYELKYKGNHGESQHRAQYHPNLHHDNVWYLTKGGAEFGAAEFETLAHDDEYIYRGLDTSPGAGAMYAPWQNGRAFATWAQRHMVIGDSFTGKGHFVQRYSKSTGDKLSSGNGDATNRCKLVAHHERFQTQHGLAFDDVIELAGLDANDNEAGEKFWFARDFGMVQWFAPSHYEVNGYSCVSEIHGIGQRPDNRMESVPKMERFAWA